MLIQADPDPDPGQTLQLQKLIFYIKNVLEVCNIVVKVKKHTYKYLLDPDPHY
jgi:hypothetical protein